MLERETIPSLEKDRERSSRRAEKFEAMARQMQKEWKEKEVINESLMERITWLEKQLEEGKGRERDLEEQNRDLSFFISGQEKLKEMQGNEVMGLEEDEVRSGYVEVGKKEGQGSRRKGKGRKN